MTPKQKQQFNIMRDTLIRISKGYQTPKQMRRECEKGNGLDFAEMIEMVYENVQDDARFAVKGVRPIDTSITVTVTP